jgi:hypothetical protein
MSFTGKLRLEEGDFDHWGEWTLLEPLTFRDITVPAGFTCDGASVPRPLWWFLPTWGRHSRAAVVHDYLCRLARSGTPHVAAPNRAKADAVFFDAMVECGVNITVRWLVWLAVRIAGEFKP